MSPSMAPTGGASGSHDVYAELAALRSELPAGCILTACPALVKLKLSKTRIKSVNVSMHMPAQYPDVALSADFTSATLPEPLLAKFSAAAEKEARNHVGHGQLLPVVLLVRRLLETNLLLSCWEEIRQAQELLGEGVLRLHERSGRITAKLSREAYRAEIQLSVPDAYPEEQPALTILSSNFERSVTELFLVQARELMRKLHDGTPAAALTRADGGKTKPTELLKGKKEINVDLSHRGLSDLKADTEFLAQYRDVRDYAQRKERRHLVHAKKKADEAAASGAPPEQHRHEHTPQKSAWPVLNFLATQFVWRMAQEECQLCKERVLPAVPSSPSSAATEPIRAHCGHWYHLGCLDPHMTTPPFDKTCPACARPIQHPRWTANKKLLEKRWAYEQAKQREVGEVMDFMGM